MGISIVFFAFYEIFLLISPSPEVLEDNEAVGGTGTADTDAEENTETIYEESTEKE